MEWTLKIEAEDKVKKEGIVKIAKNLKNNNVDVEIIIKSTGLTKNEIEKF